jgi:hypothetical protein
MRLGGVVNTHHKYNGTIVFSRPTILIWFVAGVAIALQLKY